MNTGQGMVQLEYYNGKEWVPAAKALFRNESLAWASLGGDNRNYRTVDAQTDQILTDKSIPFSKEELEFRIQIYERVLQALTMDAYFKPSATRHPEVKYDL